MKSKLIMLTALQISTVNRVIPNYIKKKGDHYVCDDLPGVEINEDTLLRTDIDTNIDKLQSLLGDQKASFFEDLPKVENEFIKKKMGNHKVSRKKK